MQDKDELAQIQKQKEIAAQISVLHTPQFWMYSDSEDREWHVVGGEDNKNKGEKEQNGKMSDIGQCIGSDCKLSYCTLCNESDFVSALNNVKDCDMAKWMIVQSKRNV